MEQFTECTLMFENLVISYKCKTILSCNKWGNGFENLVISYKCKTSPILMTGFSQFENLVISYKCKTTKKNIIQLH